MAGQPHKPTKRRKPREDEVIRKMFYRGISRQIAQIDAKKVNKKVFLEWCALNFFFLIFDFDSPRRMKLWDGKPKGAKGDLAAGQSNWHYLDQAIHKDTQDWNTIPVNHRNYLLPRILCINSQEVKKSANISKLSSAPNNLFTKYIHIKSTTVYVTSSEFGLSHPWSQQRVCPSPQNREGGDGHSRAGEGLGESQFQRLEKRLSTLPILCEFVIRRID